MTDAPEKDYITIKIGMPLDKVEELIILRTLEVTKDDQHKAARMLGISIKTLQRKLRQYSTPR